MIQTYRLTGMTCGSCVSKVKEALSTNKKVIEVVVSKEDETATISMESLVALSDFQKVLDSKYQILEQHLDETAVSKSWIETYKPILLIFFYISLVSFLVQLGNENFDLMQAMQHFMAGFFLVFSFFKLLNLNGFAASYRMYDVIAKKIPAWGYIYAFLELVLGIAFLVNFNPIITNTITVVVMSISIIGVLQAVFKKQKIQCACLGVVFNLPMSTVTIIEDALMIVMSGFMLAQLMT